MPNLVRVELIALLPTQAGCAVFLGDGSKVILFYIDPAVGLSINAVMTGQKPPRPLTHDLLANVLTSLGAKVDRVVINDFRNGIYFGRLIITAENELQQRKIIEIDARSSDCMAMAALQKSPIYVNGAVWEEVEDMTPLLEKLQNDEGGETSPEKEES
jgi:bifunctional DNase/RNase